MAKPVQITSDEALEMQWSMISRWKPRYDTWPFTYGNGLLAGAASLTGMYLNRASRKALRVGPHGLRMSFMPTALLPPFFSAIGHTLMVSSSILLHSDGCPTCTEMRAVVIQLGVGLLYPAFMAPLTNMYFAKAFYTATVPHVYQARELARLWWSITKPLMGRIRVIAVGHVLLAAAVTYSEMLALDRIEAKMDTMLV